MSAAWECSRSERSGQIAFIHAELHDAEGVAFLAHTLVHVEPDRRSASWPHRRSTVSSCVEPAPSARRRILPSSACLIELTQREVGRRRCDLRRCSSRRCPASRSRPAPPRYRPDDAEQRMVARAALGICAFASSFSEQQAVSVASMSITVRSARGRSLACSLCAVGARRASTPTPARAPPPRATVRGTAHRQSRSPEMPVSSTPPAEQVSLVALSLQISETIPAVGEHHRQVAQYNARIVRRAPLRAWAPSPPRAAVSARPDPPLRPPARCRRAPPDQCRPRCHM